MVSEFTVKEGGKVASAETSNDKGSGRKKNRI